MENCMMFSITLDGVTTQISVDFKDDGVTWPSIMSKVAKGLETAGFIGVAEGLQVVGTRVDAGKKLSEIFE